MNKDMLEARLARVVATARSDRICACSILLASTTFRLAGSRPVLTRSLYATMRSCIERSASVLSVLWFVSEFDLNPALLRFNSQTL